MHTYFVSDLMCWVSSSNIFFLHSIDWTEDETCFPGDKTGDVSHAKEEETIEGDSEEDDSHHPITI